MLQPFLQRLVTAPLLLALACMAAGLYGAVHNQISFTVGPSYFFELKFMQFQIHPENWGRQGAAFVGMQASWWMGAVLGVPVLLATLFVRGYRQFVGAYIAALSIVIAVTLLVGLGALLFAALTFSPSNLPGWMDGRQVSDPLGFALAGHMHNFSYLGGLIGACCGIGWSIRAAIRSRRL